MTEDYFTLITCDVYEYFILSQEAEDETIWEFPY
jgi:hypothetical protein